MNAMVRLKAALSLTVLLCYVIFSAACGSGDARIEPGVTIEPLFTSTPRTSPLIGGKPATPANPPTATPEPAIDADAEPTQPPEDEAPSQPEVLPTATPTPLALDGSTAPTDGRWIEIDVTAYTVRLMDGATVMQEIAPVGVGTLIDTGEYASTQTGLFAVHTKIEELAYDPPYDTYISHWVGYDIDRANGFHSFLKDESGAVVDPSTGRVSNGCIRTGAAEAIYAYAEIGIPVWVHW